MCIFKRVCAEIPVAAAAKSETKRASMQTSDDDAIIDGQSCTRFRSVSGCFGVGSQCPTKIDRRRIDAVQCRPRIFIF